LTETGTKPTNKYKNNCRETGEKHLIQGGEDIIINKYKKIDNGEGRTLPTN